MNGPGAHAVFRFLKAQTGGADIEWNFATKFLVDATGTAVRRYDNQTPPAALEADIVALLKQAGTAAQ